MALSLAGRHLHQAFGDGSSAWQLIVAFAVNIDGRRVGSGSPSNSEARCSGTKGATDRGLRGVTS